jgi:cytochrome c-type biogenesis protein CcsB
MGYFGTLLTFPIFFLVFLRFFELKWNKSRTLHALSSFFLGLSTLLFSGFLVYRWIKGNYFPISNLFESLIFLCCMLLLLCFFIEQKTKTKLITTIISPIILALTLFANYVLPKSLQEISPLVPSLQSDWLMFHVSTMILSYATLIIGSLLSILYLSLSFLTKTETFKLAYSKTLMLENLDIFSYRIIGIGFPLLTLGIIAGAVWANEAWGNYWSWDPKETWALITWLIFATYLHARIVKKWEKEKAAIIASIGFFIIWLCYLGVNFLSKGLHSYGFLS